MLDMMEERISHRAGSIHSHRHCMEKMEEQNSGIQSNQLTDVAREWLNLRSSDDWFTTYREQVDIPKMISCRAIHSRPCLIDFCRRIYQEKYHLCPSHCNNSQMADFPNTPAGTRIPLGHSQNNSSPLYAKNSAGQGALLSATSTVP